MKKSISAGFLIALAADLYLQAPKPLGALLFCFALYFICLFELNLFTGKIGWFGVKSIPYLWILVGNFIGVAAAVFLLPLSPQIIETAQAVVETKAALSVPAAFANGAMCGVLMFIAVYSWAKGFAAGCFLCVATFILCGFEHSIADMAYMAMAGNWSWNLAWIILGNAAGAIICRGMICDE